MRLLELNKEWGINETPTDARHYEQEAELYYFELFAITLLKSYAEDNYFDVYPAETHKVCEVWATREEPPQYSETHEFDLSKCQEIYTEGFSLDIYLEGEYNAERCINTLNIDKVELNFVSSSIELNSDEVKKIILDNLNIVE